MRKEIKMPIYSEGRVLPAQSRGDRDIANASTAHCTAFSVLGEHSGTRSQAESYTELCHQKIEGARSDVTEIQEQVLFTFGRQNEKRHFFDMVVTNASSERIAYTQTRSAPQVWSPCRGNADHRLVGSKEGVRQV